MTRINLVGVKTLSDQHLFTEWREIPRIVAGLNKRLNKGVFEQKLDTFVLGTGHMVFFYDKMIYLSKRYRKLTKELKRRNYKITEYEDDPFLSVPKRYQRDWRARPSEVNISKQRLLEKLKQRPKWYRYEGEIRPTRYFKELMK